jgi:hypothetical protein
VLQEVERSQLDTPLGKHPLRSTYGLPKVVPMSLPTNTSNLEMEGASVPSISSLSSDSGELPPLGNQTFRARQGPRSLQVPGRSPSVSSVASGPRLSLPSLPLDYNSKDEELLTSSASPPRETPRRSHVSRISRWSVDNAFSAGASGPSAPRSAFFRTEDSRMLGKILHGVHTIKTMAAVALEPLGGYERECTTGRAHDTKIECILARDAHIFTATAASHACDAQIRMWVQGRDTKE